MPSPNTSPPTQLLLLVLVSPGLPQIPTPPPQAAVSLSPVFLPGGDSSGCCSCLRLRRTTKMAAKAPTSTTPPTTPPTIAPTGVLLPLLEAGAGEGDGAAAAKVMEPPTSSSPMASSWAASVPLLYALVSASWAAAGSEV